MKTMPLSTPRYLLGGLLALVAINAFAGGYYGMSGAPGVPVDWLLGTPFRSYFAPSFILFVVVGGSSLVATLAVLARKGAARAAAVVAAVVILVWIGVQVSLIGFVSWLQPLVAAMGVMILRLALTLAD